ncbi:hypothetical protein DFJ77DRAFT_457359 [Powellomyces hirtus]|nr:hypothetical protein DFJ77DRAFT_457359 [Powellomyces hirtus]
MDNWSVEETCARIRALGPDYVTVSIACAEAQIEGKVLNSMSSQEVETTLKGELGVTSFGLRKTLAKAIEGWKREYPSASSTVMKKAKNGRESTVEETRRHLYKSQRSSDASCKRPPPTSVSQRSVDPKIAREQPPQNEDSQTRKKRRIAPTFVGPCRITVTHRAAVSQLVDYTNRKEIALQRGEFGTVGYKYEPEADFVDAILEGEDVVAADAKEAAMERRIEEQCSELSSNEEPWEVNDDDDDDYDVTGDPQNDEDSEPDVEEETEEEEDKGDEEEGAYREIEIGFAGDGMEPEGQSNVISLDSDEEHY